MKKRHYFNYHPLSAMLFCALLATNALMADIISPDGRRPRRPGPAVPAPVPVPPPTPKEDKPPVPPQKPEPPKPEPLKPEPPKPEPPRPHEHPLPPQPGLPGEKPEVGKPHEQPKPQPPPKKRGFWQRIKSWF